MHMYRVLVMSDINFTITIVALKNILIVNIILIYIASYYSAHNVTV